MTKTDIAILNVRIKYLESKTTKITYVLIISLICLFSIIAYQQGRIDSLMEVDTSIISLIKELSSYNQINVDFAETVTNSILEIREFVGMNNG